MIGSRRPGAMRNVFGSQIIRSCTWSIALAMLLVCAACSGGGEAGMPTTGTGFEGPRVSVVGNVLLHGVDTPPEREFVGSNSNGAAFLQDNLAFDRAGAPALVKGDTVAVLARPKDRDSVDLRIVADVRARTGRIIDSQDDVGGYPTAIATQRVLDVPADVDAWLRALAAELE